MTKLLLIGDSIRLHYQPWVAAALEGVIKVDGPPVNCQSSREVLANVQSWVLDQHADIVHLNCGLHDLRIDPSTLRHNVDPDQYARNLEALFSQLVRPAGPQLIWASSTPLNEYRHQRSRASIRREQDVVLYNDIARSVTLRHGVALHDLHQAVNAAGRDELLGVDGLHFTPTGYRFLAGKVVSAVRACATGAV